MSTHKRGHRDQAQQEETVRSWKKRLLTPQPLLDTDTDPSSNPSATRPAAGGSYSGATATSATQSQSKYGMTMQAMALTQSLPPPLRFKIARWIASEDLPSAVLQERETQQQLARSAAKTDLSTQMASTKGVMNVGGQEKEEGKADEVEEADLEGAHEEDDWLAQVSQVRVFRRKKQQAPEPEPVAAAVEVETVPVDAPQAVEEAAKTDPLDSITTTDALLPKPDKARSTDEEEDKDLVMHEASHASVSEATPAVEAQQEATAEARQDETIAVHNTDMAEAESAPVPAESSTLPAEALSTELTPSAEVSTLALPDEIAPAAAVEHAAPAEAAKEVAAGLAVLDANETDVMAVAEQAPPAP